MPKKISDLTAVSSLQSADKVEISRSGTSTVSRDLYDEFADNIENVAGLLWNVGVNATVSASAMTIFLTQKDGSSNPSTSINRSRIAYHATSASVGGYVIIDSTATTSTIISAGSTGGAVSGSLINIFVYALNNAGTTEIGWISGRTLDETILHSSTAEGGAGAADSRGVFYSTTARANVAVRLIGVITATEATAGTWTTAPSAISPAPIKSDYFSGIWTPVITTTTGTLTSVSATGRFTTRGRVCYFDISIGITTNGTGAGAIISTLPFPAATTEQSTFASGLRLDNNTMLSGRFDTSARVLIRGYDGGYSGLDGQTLKFSGQYIMDII